jgi:3-oxoadipate enol-lactonase
MAKIKNNLATFINGDSKNIPIVFIHGFPFDHNMWNNQIEELSKEYYCITYDIRGLGESPVGDGQFTMEMFVYDLMETITELELNMPVICGLSMGGYIALRAVEKFEKKFRALILCDTKSAADNNDAKIKRAEGIKKINEQGAEKFVNVFVPNCFAEESLSKSFYRETLKRSLNSSPVGVKGCLLAMVGRTETTEYLSKIKIPVLVVCGEKDQLSPSPGMKEMANTISDSQFQIIPGAGHLSPLENPEAVSKAIKDFLSRKTRN